MNGSAAAEVPHGEPGSTVRECKCKPGFGSPTGEGICRLCPAASYSPGGTMEDCKPCPFGKTTRPGARSVDECEPVPQACPVGQIALPGAVSPSQCVCLPGHGGKTGPRQAHDCGSASCDLAVIKINLGIRPLSKTARTRDGAWLLQQTDHPLYSGFQLCKESWRCCAPR